MNDGLASYELALACLREQRVRAGSYKPVTDEERQQRLQGSVPVAQLASVQSPKSETRT